MNKNKKCPEFENILNSMSDPVHITNKDFELEFANRSCIELFGHYIPGVKCYRYFHDLGSHCEWCRHEEVLMGTNYRYESYFEKNHKYFEANQSPLRKTNGEIAKLVILRDITQRKRFETELRESEEQFYRMFNSMTEGVALHEVISNEKGTPTDYMIVKVNRAYELQTGLSVKDAEGKRASQLYGTGKPPYFDIFIKVVDTGEPHEFITYFEPMKKYFRISVFSPAPKKFATVFDDITERMLSEKALRESEERLNKEKEFAEKLLEATVDTVFIFEPATGKAVRWNEAFKRVTGYSDEEIALLKCPDSYYDRADLCRAEEAMERILNNGKGTVELSLITKGGERIPFEYSASVLSDRAGGPALFISIGRDITERQNIERILQLRLRLIEYSELNPINMLIRKALDEICDMTGSPIGFFHLFEEERRMLTLTEWSTRTATEFCKADGRGAHYDIDKAGVWCDCVRERRPVVHNDYASLPNRRGLPAGHARVVREMVVPVIKDDRIVSVMGIGNKTADYNEHDLNIVTNIADVIWSIVERKQARDALRERVKELDCLYEISKLLIEPGNTMEDIITRTLSIIPRSWKYSDITCARIMLEGKTYKPGDFVETPWRQASLIKYQRNGVGIVEVFYREERGQEDEGPFLVEERELINGISELLSIAYGNKKTEERLKLLNKAMDTIEVGVTITDICGKIIYTNPAEAKMHGYAVEELIGRQASIFAPTKPQRSYAALNIDDMTHWKRESINVSTDGSSFPVQLISIPVKDATGKAIGLVTASEDITDRKRLEEQLKRLATTDPLTGCSNRRHFFDLGEKEVNRCHRYGRTLSVLIMDIDHFKAINDEYGHSTGDKTLINLSKTCLSIVRNTDIFGRLGGEEFGIIFIESQLKDAMEMAERLRLELSKSAVRSGKDVISFTVSIGVSEMRQGDQSLEAILRRADNALYEAKNGGRNCIKAL